MIKSDRNTVVSERLLSEGLAEFDNSVVELELIGIAIEIETDWILDVQFRCRSR